MINPIIIQVAGTLIGKIIDLIWRPKTPKTHTHKKVKKVVEVRGNK
jgi:hypothetical protein